MKYEMTLPWLLLILGICSFGYWMFQTDKRIKSVEDKQWHMILEFRESYSIIMQMQGSLGEKEIRLLYIEDWRDSILLPELNRGEVTKREVRLLRKQIRKMNGEKDGKDESN